MGRLSVLCALNPPSAGGMMGYVWTKVGHLEFLLLLKATVSVVASACNVVFITQH